MLKKFPSDKINDIKNALIFLSRAQTHYSFIFNLQFFHELKHKVRLSKTVCVCRFYKNLYFCSMKCIDSLTLKRHNSFQIKSNRKAIHSFAPKPLIFKLQQEVLKFSDIYESWSSPKTDLVAKFLNFKNRNFENVSFTQ